MKNIIYLLSSFIFIAFFGGCYTFTGGSIPEHLKTLQIAAVADNSGFGDPRYKEQLTNYLISKFRGDNSFSVVDFGGDAKLSVSISSIRDETYAVKAGELESQRKITVTCKAQYYDNVKKKIIWDKSFSAYGVYDVANLESGRQTSLTKSLEQVSDDILLAVVSGW
jgi:hypothetical protein